MASAGRAALVLVAALGAAVVLGPGIAGAGNGETVVTSHPRPGGGYVLEATAAPGQENAFGIWRHNAGTMLRDTSAGITDDSPRCTQESPTKVRCKLQGLQRVKVDTDDMADVLGLSKLRWQNLPIGGIADLGPGKDEASIAGPVTAKGGGGGDTLQGRRGNQRLLGGHGGDHITGGRGNNDHCDGQAGNDSGGDDCETTISL